MPPKKTTKKKVVKKKTTTKRKTTKKTKKKVTKRKAVKKKATAKKKATTKRKVTKKTTKRKTVKKKATTKRKVGDPLDIAHLASAINQEAGVMVASSGDEYDLGDIPGFVSTGCLPLDAHLGEGRFFAGWPLGRIIEIYGAESHGKSTLALHALISAQRGKAKTVEWEEDDNGIYRPKVVKKNTPPGLAILIDSEATFHKGRAARMGLDLKRLLRLSGETVEQGFNHIELAIKEAEEGGYFSETGAPIVIVWDTIAASPTEAELRGDMYAEGITSKPRKVTQAMRRITQTLSRLNIILILVNQWYDQIGSRIPGQKETPGGRAMKFHASLRAEVRRVRKWFDQDKNPIGVQSVVKIEKSKMCVPYVEIPLPIRGTTGIDSAQAIFDVLTSCDPPVITRAGSRFSLPGIGKSFYSKDWKTIIKDKKTAKAVRKALLEVNRRLTK